jgi:hypothetical protein
VPLAAHRQPYTLPPAGRPTRIAFVGQRTFFESAALAVPAGGLEPSFVDFRAGSDPGELRTELAELAPHVVVAFRPHELPAGLLAGLDAAVVGVVTEPLPRPGGRRREDLDANAAHLERADPANFDRVVCTDPLGWDVAARTLPVWRSLPLPVDDRLYCARPLAPSRRPPRAIFIGYSTMHREHALINLKHEFDVGHYAYGLMGDLLRETLAGADIGLVVHGERWGSSFDHHLLVHLAAGHLVISEPIEPTFGLEPGIDFVEVIDHDELDLRMHQLHEQPDAYARVRIRGRDKAEQFRASRVWPALVGDLRDDLAAFGTSRT